MSDITILAYGLVVILIVVIIVLVVMLGSKCTRQQEYFKGTKLSKKDMSSCAEDEFELCTMYAGSDVACGCQKNEGEGRKKEYDKTNNIACGNTGKYVCNYSKYKKTKPKITCGCMYQMEKNDPMIILPEDYLD